MFDDHDLDLGKVMKKYARMNPHISMSDIAYLMDMPYSPDIDDEQLLPEGAETQTRY